MICKLESTEPTCLSSSFDCCQTLRVCITSSLHCGRSFKAKFTSVLSTNELAVLHKRQSLELCTEQKPTGLASSVEKPSWLRIVGHTCPASSTSVAQSHDLQMRTSCALVRTDSWLAVAGAGKAGHWGRSMTNVSRSKRCTPSLLRSSFQPGMLALTSRCMVYRLQCSVVESALLHPQTVGLR